MYYVYKHVRKDTGIIFYVGMGKGKRCYDTERGRNNRWKEIISETDYDIIIVKDNLSEKDAFKLEIELIAKYGRERFENGTLVNITSGGQGGRGRITSPETREKQRLANSGPNHYNWGKKVPKELALLRGRKGSLNGSFGVKKSPETIEKIRQGNLGLKQSQETIDKRIESRKRNRLMKGLINA